MTDTIAWALVHFLWQGTALALVALVLTRLASSASVRYAIGVATMAAMVSAVGVTIATGRTAEIVQGPTGSRVQRSTEVQSPTESGVQGPSAERSAIVVLPTTWILTLWIIGVVVLSIRAVGGWWVARGVARDAIVSLSDELQAVARTLAHRLGIRREVGVFESSRVSVPVMIGWLRPVVLMPPAALAGLSIAQVEAIFAHEFAHIRRHDYLVNLLQTAVETALFFHPAVWWVSREIRRERELCCDDVAVRVCDRMTYATALSALAHLQPPSLALAATDGSLRDRVRRIITNSPTSESAKGGWMAMLPLLLVVSLAAPSAFSQSAAGLPKVVPVPAEVERKVASPEPKEVPLVVTADKGMVQLKAPGMDMTAGRIEIVPESRPNQEIDQLLDEQLTLERRRLDLERARLRNAAALELQTLQAQMDRGRDALASLKKKVDSPERTGGDLDDLKNLDSYVRTEAAKLNTARESLRLSLEELEIREQELVLKRRMQKAGMDAPVERPAEVTPEHRRLVGNEAVLPGDIVNIVIDGVTGGAREFTVDAAGSIRHPQVGDVTVADHTVGGVREKIVKLLVAKGLATDPTVTVTASRR